MNEQPNWVTEYNLLGELQRKINNKQKVIFSHEPKETFSIPEIKRFPDIIHTYIVFNPKTLLTKIGRSTNYQLRIQKLQCDLGTKLILIRVFVGDKEKELHIKYSDYRHEGEWFNLTKDQLDSL